MKYARLSIAAIAVLALALTGCNQKKEVTPDQVFKFYPTQITCLDNWLIEDGLVKSSAENIEFSLKDYIKNKIVKDKDNATKTFTILEKMVSKDGFKISNREDMLSKFNEQLQEKVDVYITTGLKFKYTMKEKGNFDLRNELLEHVRYKITKDNCRPIWAEIVPPEPYKAPKNDKEEVQKIEQPITAEKVMVEYEKPMTCLSYALMGDFNETYGPDPYEVKLQLERYPDAGLGRVLPFVKYLLKSDKKALSDEDNLPPLIKNKIISRLNGYRANEEPRISLQEHVDKELKKPECVKVKSQMAERITDVSKPKKPDESEFAKEQREFEESENDIPDSPSIERKPKFRPAPNTSPASNDIVEIVIESNGVDFKNGQLVFQIAVTNLSVGKIIHPQTRAGKRIAETGFHNNAFVPDYRLENVFSGIAMIDNFGNNYPLTFLAPMEEVDNPINPGESVHYYASFKGIPVKNSNYIKLVFSREFTNSTPLEIRIKTWEHK